MTPKNFNHNEANGISFITNVNADTIVIPSIVTANQYFSYGLACTNLIMLCHKPTTVNQQAIGRSITNIYVPDEYFAEYSGWMGFTVKKLSTYNGAYKDVVMRLWNDGILVRNWL